MGNKKEQEAKDHQLFNNIASRYAEKDINLSTKIARKFQFFSLLNYALRKKNVYQNVLELGCGVGASSAYMQGHYNNYTGIDYSEALIDIANKLYANSNTHYYCKSIKDFEKKSEHFDLIFGVGILHHVTEYDMVFDKIRSFCDEDSLICFVEPQSGNPFVQLMRSVRKLLDKEYSEDQIFFSKKQITNLFEKHDFEVLSVRYQGYFSPPFAQVIMKPKFIFVPLSRLTIAFDKYLQKVISIPLAWNIVVVVKPKS